MKIHSFSPDGLGTGPWAAPSVVAAARPPAHSDVVVVGAGLTGLSAALTLAAHGLSVTVLDRQFGAGASVRSGGIVLGDTLEGPFPGFDACERRLGEWIEQKRVECDFEWTRCLELAHDGELPPEPIDWIERGPVRVALAVCGAVLDPVLLLNGVLAAARSAGAVIASGFQVDALETDGREPVAVGPVSHVAAHQIVMATDAVSWRDEGDPWTERTLTIALQTEAAPPDTAAAIGLGPRQPFYTRELPLLWGRPLRDGSFLFGRELVAFPWNARREAIAASVAEAGERLAARMRGLHPRLAALEVRRVWAGPTARTARGVPAIVRDATMPHVRWAGGYGGHGLAQAFALGRQAAVEVLAELSIPIRTA